MADIINKRDLILQQANPRIIELPPPPAVIIPGYTGVVLTKDAQMWVISNNIYGIQTVSGTNPYRMVIEAKLRGIPSGNPVIWELGNDKYILGPNNVILGVEFDPTAPHNLILTDTPDPLIKTMEASSYPKTPTGGWNYPWGLIRVSTTYGGQVFSSMMRISTFTG